MNNLLFPIVDFPLIAEYDGQAGISRGGVFFLTHWEQEVRTSMMNRRATETRILAGLLALMITMLMAGGAFAEKRVKVSSLKFWEDSIIIKYRKGVTVSYPVTVTVKPSNATNQTIKWTSSNEKVASVDENGRITPHKKGKCVITAAATDGSKKKATCKVTVKAAKADKKKQITELKILSYHKTLTIADGKKESCTLPVYLIPLDAGNISLKWTSSDPKVAKVSSKGVVTAVGAGRCTITATAKDGGGATSSVAIDVTEVAPNSDHLTLDETELTLQKGTTYTLTWHLDRKLESGSGFQMASDNESIAVPVEGSTKFSNETLAGSFDILAKDKGTCTITMSLLGSTEEKSRVKVTVTK